VLLSVAANLGYRDEDFARDLLHVALPMLDDFEASDLASVLHALPALRVQPSREWMAAFYAASDARWHEFDARGLASLAWALGALRKRPPPEWLAGFCGAADALWGEFTPQGLSNLAWGLAATRARPAAKWMGHLVGSAQQSIRRFSPQGCANFTWWARGCSAGARGCVWVQRVEKGGHDGRRGLAAGGTCALCGVRMRHADPKVQEWLPGHAYACARPAVSGAPGSAIFVAPTWASHNPKRHSARVSHHDSCFLRLKPAIWVCRGLAKLSYRPQQRFVSDLLSHSQQLLPSFSPMELSAMMYALAVLGLRPGQEWMRVFHAASAPQLEAGFGSQALSNTLWAHARLNQVGGAGRDGASRRGAGARPGRDGSAAAEGGAAGGWGCVCVVRA
jgi:hypothetical protein